MFPYPEGVCSLPERLLLTLYQAGAMAQSDLTEVLGWDEKQTSRVIVSLNKEPRKGSGVKSRQKQINRENEKVSWLRERIGSRNSGKIRLLTHDGIDLARSLTGQITSRPVLKEGEARIAANLAKFATKLVMARGGVHYFGPYLVSLHFPIPDLALVPVSCIETETGFVWLDWVSEAMSTSIIHNRIDAWRHIHSQLLIMTAKTNHKVIVVCPTDEIVRLVNNQMENIKRPAMIALTATDSERDELL